MFDEEVVSHCPIRGHSPLCSNKDCQKASENNYAECRRLFNTHSIVDDTILDDKEENLCE